MSNYSSRPQQLERVYIPYSVREQMEAILTARHADRWRLVGVSEVRLASDARLPPDELVLEFSRDWLSDEERAAKEDAQREGE